MKRTKIRLFRAACLLAVAMTALALAAACGDDEPTSGSGEGKYGGTLKATLFADNTTLDPIYTTSTTDILITQNTYDNLVLIQPDLSLKPMLATSWTPNADLTSWTFELREGVKFHHGKDFKAEDVVHSFNRMLDPVLDSPVRPTMEIIDEMTVIDDYTIRFDLVSPSAFFADTLSEYQARMVPSDIDPERMTLEEFGTGPFKIKEHLPGERTVLVKNEDYWEEGLPYLDEVQLLLIPEPETRAEALKSGDVDMIFLMQHQSAPGVEANEGSTVHQTATAGYLTLAMDMRIAPFDNKLVRKAMQAATDRELIRQAALLGNGSIAYDHPIPPNDPNFSPECAPPDYDIELAKSLLAEAGHPDGIDITLHTSTAGTGMVEMAVAFKEGAAAAGINVDILQRPEDAYWADVWLVEPFVTVFWNGRPPDLALSIVYLSDASWNESKYMNPEFDALVEQARGQIELADRQETYGKIQCILIDDVPRIIPVFQPSINGARDDVRGAEPHPRNWQPLSEIWLDR